MAKWIKIDVQERGRRGGEARARKMTPAARSAQARKAVKVRWKNAKSKKVTAAGARPPAARSSRNKRAGGSSR